jgi:hypothetical protein
MNGALSCIMFWPAVEMLLNVEQIFIENSFKSKQKFIKELGCTLDIVGKPSASSRI